jgi:hypothetical protein
VAQADTAAFLTRIAKLNLDDATWLTFTEIACTPDEKRIPAWMPVSPTATKRKPQGKLPSDPASRWIDEMMDGLDDGNAYEPGIWECSVHMDRDILRRQLYRTILEGFEDEIRSRKKGRNNVRDFNPIDKFSWDLAYEWAKIADFYIRDRVPVDQPQTDRDRAVVHLPVEWSDPADALLDALTATLPTIRKKFRDQRDTVLRRAYLTVAAA